MVVVTAVIVLMILNAFVLYCMLRVSSEESRLEEQYHMKRKSDSDGSRRKD